MYISWGVNKLYRILNSINYNIIYNVFENIFRKCKKKLLYKNCAVYAGNNLWINHAHTGYSPTQLIYSNRRHRFSVYRIFYGRTVRIRVYICKHSYDIEMVRCTIWYICMRNSQMNLLQNICSWIYIHSPRFIKVNSF